MKTKPKNFGNFFVRVGAGFLAFWLLSMGAPDSPVRQTRVPFGMSLALFI